MTGTRPHKLLRCLVPALVVVLLLPGSAIPGGTGQPRPTRPEHAGSMALRLSMRIAQAKKKEERRRYYQSLARRQKASSSRPRNVAPIVRRGE